MWTKETEARKGIIRTPQQKGWGIHAPHTHSFIHPSFYHSFIHSYIHPYTQRPHSLLTPHSYLLLLSYSYAYSYSSSSSSSRLASLSIHIVPNAPHILTNPFLPHFHSLSLSHTHSLSLFLPSTLQKWLHVHPSRGVIFFFFLYFSKESCLVSQTGGHDNKRTSRNKEEKKTRARASKGGRGRQSCLYACLMLVLISTQHRKPRVKMIMEIARGQNNDFLVTLVSWPHVFLTPLSQLLTAVAPKTP